MDAVPDISSDDPYRVLGVAPSATSAEIRRAHRRLVMKVHPDRNRHPKAAEHFGRVQQAYELLINPSRRAALDALRQQDEKGARVRTVATAAAATTAPADDAASAAAAAEDRRAAQRRARNVNAHSPAECARTAGPTQPRPRQSRNADGAEPVVSADEASEWLAEQLQGLGPPSPRDRAAVHPSIVVGCVYAIGSAAAGIIMMISDQFGAVGAVVLLSAAVVPWTIVRLASGRRAL